MTCAHHWLIETPHGEHTVMGCCRICGAEREFQASTDEYEWRDSQKDRTRRMVLSSKMDHFPQSPAQRWNGHGVKARREMGK